LLLRLAGGSVRTHQLQGEKMSRVTIATTLAALFIAMSAIGAGAVSAQTSDFLYGINPQSLAWPPGAGTGRTEGPTVSARGTGKAAGSPIYRGRVFLSRRDPDREKAVATLDALIEEIGAFGGVDIKLTRREPSRTMMEQPLVNPSYTPGQPLPAIPPRGQMTQVWMEQVSIEVEAPTRKAISDWAAKIPPTPPVNANQQPMMVYPNITERVDEDDPAWAQATRNALALAERDARIAAIAAGGELGRLTGVWTERLSFVQDGAVQVSVTAEYLIAKPRR
jgi:hypothetical protein